MINFPCPMCLATLKAPEDKAGARSKCPKCGSAVTVPKRPGPNDSTFPIFSFLIILVVFLAACASAGAASLAYAGFVGMPTFEASAIAAAFGLLAWFLSVITRRPLLIGLAVVGLVMEVSVVITNAWVERRHSLSELRKASELREVAAADRRIAAAGRRVTAGNKGDDSPRVDSPRVDDKKNPPEKQADNPRTGGAEPEAKWLPLVSQECGTVE